MRCFSLLLAVLATFQCVRSFVSHQTPIVSRTAASSSIVAGGRAGRGEATSPTMCVPKEVAAAILVAGAGYLITQGVPPAKAADLISMSSSTPTTCIMREAATTQKLDKELGPIMYALQPKSALSEDCITKALLSDEA